MNKKQQLYDISYLRSIAIIAVVLFHAFCPYMNWHYFKSENTPYYISVFYTWGGARMPLFLFISGFLFSFLQNEKNKYKEFGSFLINKTHRLLIPYLIFAIVIQYSNGKFTWQNVLKGYWHLWFLLMLFWSFLISWGLKFIKTPIFHILFLLAVSYASMYIKKKYMLSLNYLIHYYVWFLWGYLIALYKHKLNAFFKIKAIIIYLAIWIIGSYWRDAIGFRNLHLLRITTYFCTTSFILFVFGTFNYLREKGHLKQYKVVEKLNQYSYGIYVFHVWIVMQVFMHDRNYYAWIADMASKNTLLFPISLFIFTLALSTTITHYSLKTKVGRYLIG